MTVDDKLKEILNIIDNNIEKDIDWLFSTEGYKSMPIVASNLSRILNHMKSNKPFCLISGFRPQENNYDQSSPKYKEQENINYNINLQRNKELAIDIRNDGYGFIQVDGVWRGIDKDGNKYESRENSFFVIGYNKDIEKSIPFDKFKKEMVILCKKYNQEAIIVGHYIDDNKYFIELVDKNGKTCEKFENIEIPSEKKLFEMFEKHRKDGSGHTSLKRKKNRNFIINGIYAYRPLSMYSASNGYIKMFENASGVDLITW